METDKWNRKSRLIPPKRLNYQYQQFRIFAFGIALGLMIAYIQTGWDSYSQEIAIETTPLNHTSTEKIVKSKIEVSTKTETLEHNSSRPIHEGNVSQTKEKANTPRILCLVLTKKANHRTKAIHVKQTWGKRCNILIFMSTTNNDSLLETVKVNVKDGRNHLYDKTKASFQYIYKHYKDQADWFFKADDDTYVIVDNLRSFLSHYESTEPVYFGCKFRPFVPQGYMSGGAGYVLSREALERFMDGLYSSFPSCVRKAAIEDVQMGKCLYAAGVLAGDSRDEHGSFRFLPFDMQTHMDTKLLKLGQWYLRYIYYPQPQGVKCCSDEAVSFHYVQQPWMYTMEYFLYVLRLPYIL